MLKTAVRTLAPLVALALLGAGCSLLGIKEQRAVYEGFARMRGTVRVEPAVASQIVVVLLRPDSAGPVAADQGTSPVQVVDYFVLEGAGAFVFVTMPGTFRIAAFADLNANLIYDP